MTAERSGMSSRLRLYPRQLREDEAYDDHDERKVFANEPELHDSELNEDLLCGVEILNEGDIDEQDELQFMRSQGYKGERRIIKPRKRRRGADDDSSLDHDIDYAATNYYHRYKNKAYVRRNDVGKYCQVCKAKRLGGRSRGLPSDLQLRKLWILRFNLEPERAAELWVKDAFADNSHSGEVCAMHFPEGSDSYRNSRDVLPIDMREPHLMSHDPDDVDFGNMILTCVFCNAERPLKSMIPFARARFRRRRWITALSGNDAQTENHLREALKNGATKFLCDWHFADVCFSINTFGEWKLKKDALPNPHLEENERTTMRIYMINHVDSTVQRNDELRRRRVNFLLLRKHAQEKERMDRENTRSVIDKMRRTFPRLVSDGAGDHMIYESDHLPSDFTSGNGRRLNSDNMHNSTEYLEIDPEMPLLYPDHADGPSEVYQERPSTSQGLLGNGYYDPFVDGNVDFSDESDTEMEIIQKMQRTVDVVVSEARQCEYCHVIVSLERSKSEHRMRTWPYDDVKHEKYLSIMQFPKDFEEELRRLWVKRRIEPLDVVAGSVYKYPTISICQHHLELAGVFEQIDSWLSKYCVLCDEELGDENLLLPFPLDRSSRLAWAKSLFLGKPVNNLVHKQQRWLRERLTRETATRYRLCLFHFPKSSFSVSKDCIDFDQTSQPLSLNICQYEKIPRGPQGVVKCPLCDTWNVEADTTQIRTPRGAAERNFLVEFLISGDKATLRRGVEKLSAEASTICKAHMEKDPFELIAERRLVGSIMAQCVACSVHDFAQNMTPFPHEPAERTMWVDSMSRRRANRMRLLNRLSMEGRHYLCPQHFHVNALRYIPGLGIFKKAFFLPTHDANEQVITRVPEPHEDDYNPILIEGFDNEKVQWTLDYDKVISVVGEPSEEIHQEFDDEHFEMTSSYRGLDHPLNRDQEEKPHPVVIDGERSYSYEQDNGDPEELHGNVQIIPADGETQILLEELPIPEREEIVRTGGFN
ncbi:unnamed protein product [Haemonchus placei]|uniref:THAP-type domain-containing protein n=1 Tax=Haemonchus placei TaxID=6290 RepID=A0A0N4WCA2_HAEPC|nr:unnamed protein product [Haemonchus placei]